MSKPGFALFYDTAGNATAILSVTDGPKGADGPGGARAHLVLADIGGVSELPLSEHDLRWLITELQERLPSEANRAH